jgi:hypothetical protein
VGMLNIYRSFPVSQINVVDAQYVYREVPIGSPLSNSTKLPFFYASLPEGTYPGLSIAGGQFNCICPAHYRDGDTLLGDKKPVETEPPPPDTAYEDEEGYIDDGWILPDDSIPPDETEEVPETEPPETEPPETEAPAETQPADIEPPESETEAETEPEIDLPDFILPDW